MSEKAIVRFRHIRWSVSSCYVYIVLCSVMTLLEDHLRNLKSENGVVFKQAMGEVKRSEKSQLVSRVVGGLAPAPFFLQWWGQNEPGEVAGFCFSAFPDCRTYSWNLTCSLNCSLKTVRSPTNVPWGDVFEMVRSHIFSKYFTFIPLVSSAASKICCLSVQIREKVYFPKWDVKGSVAFRKGNIV